MKKTFFFLWLSHVFVDFLMGIWPLYKTLANIDIAIAGIIMGIAGFCGEILQIAFGYLSDIGHRKKVFLFGLLIPSAALFLTFANSFTNLLLLMLCVMVGSGSYHPAAVGLASSLFSSKGKAILFFTSGGALGLGLSQLIFTKSIQVFNGHAYPLVFPIVLLGIFWFFHKLPSHLLERKPPPLRDFFAPFAAAKGPLLLLYATQVLSYGVLLSFIFLLPDILKSKGSTDWLFLGGGHMSFILGSMISMLLLGPLCDRLGFKKTLIGAMSLAIIFISVFLFLPLPPGFFAIFFLGLLGASLYLSNPLIIAWGNHLVPQSPSTVSAFLMGLAWCLSNLIPALAGVLASGLTTAPYIVSLGLISLLLIPSLFCVFLMPQSHVLEIIPK